MKTKIATIILTTALLILPICSCASDRAGGQLIVGSITQLSGDFYAGFSNNASDANVRELIHGYSTVVYTKEGEYDFDETVVKTWKSDDNPDGSKTYTITINDDLTWNDGTAITAEDYVFDILMTSSNAFYNIDADNAGYDYIVGWEEYSQNGGSFEGVHLIDENTFTIQVSSYELPFYYDKVYASVTPDPMFILAPDADIVESENGASITGTFDENVLNFTMLNTDTGYRYNPKVTCGPYNLESYDNGAKIATLTVNDKFKGNYNGIKPSIEKIIIKEVKNDTQIDELSSGSVDLIQSVSGAEGITQGLALTDTGNFDYISYPRAGYGRIMFVCDYGPTKYTAVRRAVAYCLDVPEFARQYSGGYAEVVYGAYGQAQWMYEDNKRDIADTFETYSLDLDKARDVLIADGWVYDENGNDYTSGIRYKKTESGLMPLIINWCNTPDNPVSTLLSQMLPQNMEAVGMKLNAETVEFAVLMGYVYRTAGEMKYNMYNLATGYYPIFDPSDTYSTDETKKGYPNSNGIEDEQLSSLATSLKHTEAGDKEAYSEKWFQFQKRWNELLPDIPLYSDMYHDFFNSKLKDYDTDPFWRWTYAIIEAHIE